jgi:hypothetical protein
MFELEKPKEFSNLSRDLDYLPDHVCLLLSILFPVFNLVLATPNPVKKVMVTLNSFIGGHVVFTFYAWFAMILIIFFIVIPISAVRSEGEDFD